MIKSKILNILLADDDMDDCQFFKKALESIPIPTELFIVRDGEELMTYLAKNEGPLPDFLFLDLNMPRKNGFECLCEIRENERWNDLPVVMFSTAFPRDPNYEADLIKSLMNLGAHHFIRKPNEITKLKKVIHETLINLAENKS